MKRVLPSGAAAFALLLLPAAAQAKPQAGALLRVDRAHHRVEIVDARRAVHSYFVPRRAVRKLRAGARVTFSAKGKRVSSLRVRGKARKLSFYGKVVSSGGKGLVLRLGDGQRLRLGKQQLSRHARRAHGSSVQINLEGFDPGQVLLITETFDGRGNLSITIKLVQNADPGGDDQDARGTITAVGDGTVTVQVDGQGELTFQADGDLLDGFEVGDQVDVSYYQDGEGTLVADDIEWLDDSGDDVDAIGTVTALGDGSLTAQVDGQGELSFQVDDSELLDGVSVGDQVDVTYFQDDDGTLVADDVEPANDSGE